MDSLSKVVTLRELAPAVRRSYSAIRNEVKQDPSDPSRGTLHFFYRSLPLFRLGKAWLAREEDVQALFSTSSASPAPTPTPAPTPARRGPGRPRREVEKTGSAA